MKEETIETLQSIHTDLLFIQHRLLALSGMLIDVGQNGTPLNDAELIGVGYILKDVGEKISNDMDTGITDQIDDFRNLLWLIKDDPQERKTETAE